LGLLFFAEAKEESVELSRRGSLVGDNAYRNPALGMTILLPGVWHFSNSFRKTTAEPSEKRAPSRAGCGGPLCGSPEIAVALGSVGTTSIHAVFLDGYKLSPEYQNRGRHPLRWFAEVMASRSLGSHWVPDGKLSLLRLGGKPAYRLDVHNRTKTSAKGFLYVADSNGYVFLLVATAVSDPETLRTAIEKMTFDASAP
jgi:hypothetical protein